MFETWKKSHVDNVFLHFSGKLRYKRERQLRWNFFSNEIRAFVNLKEHLDFKSDKTDIMQWISLRLNYQSLLDH